MAQLYDPHCVLVGCTLQASASHSLGEFDTLFLFSSLQLRFSLRWVSRGLIEAWSVSASQPMWAFADSNFTDLDLDAHAAALGLDTLGVEVWRADFAEATVQILAQARAAAEAYAVDQGEAWSRYAETLYSLSHDKVMSSC